MLRSGTIEETTHAKYLSEASLILRFIEDVSVNRVTAAMVRKMDQDMLKRGYVRETIARAHNALKRYLYVTLEKHYIAMVPITRNVKPARGAKGPQRPGRRDPQAPALDHRRHGG